MCGIAGWLTATGPAPRRAVVDRMTDVLAHRGPDGRGVYLSRHCALGHRRLSIVDLGGGAQPMVHADGQTVVTFNGEIFNHRQLRRELERRGHVFRTNSDTEVLLHGYRAWGARLPERLNGMFAFCVWDAATQTALLARDRMGQKPLYTAELPGGTLLFASELKALLEHSGVSRRLNVPALAMYLTHEYVPFPYAAIDGIRKLEPGARLVWRAGAVERGPYVQLAFGAETVARSEAEWIDETRAALSRSVERRLMSDVPLGVFLSGGIDSSAVVALMTDHVAPRDIQTFSIAFDDPSFDESAYARMVAAHFGTTHRARTFAPSALLATLPEVVSTLDEPFGDASILPTTLLSAFTREHVTVALGGDGGDELFCGYETFRADTAAEVWKRVPRPARAAAVAAIDRLPVRADNFSLDFVLKRFVRGADSEPALRHVRWLSSFVPHTADDPLVPELRASVPDADVFAVMAQPYIECRDPRHLQRLSYAYIRSYLAEDILTKVDRASMTHSLEVRSPFMDPEFVSLVARMPPELKLRAGFGAKYALKRAVAGRVPDAILRRRKKGFGIPVAKWLNGPLAGEADRLLAPGRVAAAGVFVPAVVTRLLDEHRSGARDNRKQLWTLMMFEAWRERFDVGL